MSLRWEPVLRPASDNTVAEICVRNGWELGPLSHLGRSALDYAEGGWSVFPLAEGSKLPKIPKKAGGRGFYDATTDPRQVSEWWQRWPRANIGIRTGVGSGLLVLDIDVDKGGPESLTTLVSGHGALPVTLMADTPTGGEHRYYAWPGGDLTISAGKLGSGLDTRGEGGYVAAPPSVRSEGVYAWANEAPIAAAPAWLVTLLAKPEPVQPRPVFVFTPRGPSAYGDAALERAVREVSAAPLGQGNGTLNGTAYSLGRLVGAGLLDRQVVEEALVAAAIGRGRELESRARTIVGSGIDAGMANPRQVTTFQSASAGR